MKKKTWWTEELVISELRKSMSILGIERMPSGNELKSIERNDLHCKISKTKKYRGWAEYLGLEMKASETLTGQLYEDLAAETIRGKGYDVSLTSAIHPYDLLVEGVLKIDVKVANPYKSKDYDRVHTARLGKVDQVCDLYIVILLDEQKEVERFLVIPSHLVRVETITVIPNSKYNVYDQRYDYIEKYVEFFKSVK